MQCATCTAGAQWAGGSKGLCGSNQRRETQDSPDERMNLRKRKVGQGEVEVRLRFNRKRGTCIGCYESVQACGLLLLWPTQPFYVP